MVQLPSLRQKGISLHLSLMELHLDFVKFVARVEAILFLLALAQNVLPEFVLLALKGQKDMMLNVLELLYLMLFVPSEILLL